ncbi:hypothetical protein [Paracoccus sp. (in: a-proteobacteria)]|uniref:hypothetical protein n=1 Tax=Paracoccus sp. TaxID=267 RepID=UPI0026DF1185|nr:hypothetical protein [Paracoccus sp. (in: a-proteobacteria)]MDO5646350.1 hypothetical protein [Paracoccus sp. (in: a-proteobacteria)]
MKNPFLSIWLSAVNQIAAPMRGQMMAEMSKMQRKMIRDGQQAWLQAWGFGKRR